VIGFTTGRQTSQRLNSLLKELAHIVPSAKIIRRGKSNRQELASRLHDEGLSHAVVIYRWHGGPGRVDLLNVRSDGVFTIRTSAILKGVRLKREYHIRGNHVARAITCDESVSEETRRFCLVLADVLELPEMSLSTYHEIDTSLHVNELPDQTLQLAVTSPTGTREVGPKLLISRLLWDQGD